MKFDGKTFYAVKEIVRKNGRLELPAQGTSMFPLIKQGNICEFISCEGLELKKGDIVLFRDANGQLVAHRFLNTVWKNKEQHYLFKGDTNLGKDIPVGKEQIIGKLEAIKKGKTTIYAAGLPFILWRRLILAFPLTSSFLRTYLTYKEAKK